MSFMAQNGAVECRGRSKWRSGGSKWRPGAWKVCGKIVADSDHTDEEQDPDPVPH